MFNHLIFIREITNEKYSEQPNFTIYTWNEKMFIWGENIEILSNWDGDLLINKMDSSTCEGLGKSLGVMVEDT